VLGRAQRLAEFTIGWNLIEGSVAIGAAWIAGSSALAGFGLDSAVESVSGAILLWRLRAERHDPQRAERVEHVATRAIGASFFLLAVFVVVEAIRSLAGHEQPHPSPVGIGVTAASLIVMTLLARAKRRAGTALESRATKADSAQSRACACLCAVVLAGLLLNASLGWWWADPVAAIGVAMLLLREGRQALTSEHIDDCC
jgi:cation diffusion facilitator family transporter